MVFVGPIFDKIIEICLRELEMVATNKYKKKLLVCVEQKLGH